MIILKTIQQLQQHIQQQYNKKLTIGLVPTMGALHEGHLSLLKKSKHQCDISICSIFVNPTQFNDVKDFEKYPITLENDIILLEKANCDILFLPSVKEIYPEGIERKQPFELGNIENMLEGSFRPGHFQGVCQVVNRLLDIVQPQQLFLGQKDYQQCMVLSKLLELTGKIKSIQINVCPIIREPSGLAMSSRNARLSVEEKQKAIAIYQSLQLIKQNINLLPIPSLKKIVRLNLVKSGFEKIDYIAIAQAQTLEPVEEWDKRTPLIALIAASLNGVRLIDNMKIN
jgi:pantoate--beta-alanine ligase